MKIRVLSLLLIFGFMLNWVSAQDAYDKKAFLTQLEQQHLQLLKQIKTDYSGKKDKALSQFYKTYYEDLKHSIDDEDFVFNTPFNAYTNQILNQIKVANPTLSDTPLMLLIAKDNTPNAFCMPDGTFVVNMGLFNWMDNEDQVAAILSHEIAHKALNHSTKYFLKKLEDREQTKSLSKKIKSEESSNKSQKAFNLIKSQIYARGKEKRKTEIEADSLGYTFFKNTKYHKAETINALRVLQEFDSISPKALQLETYKKLYNLPNLAFKEAWLKEEDFSLYNYNFYKEKLSKDSLSTHPEMTDRINHLKKEFSELKKTEKPQLPTKEYKALQTEAKKNFLSNYYHSEDYGVGVYACMHLLQSTKNDKVSQALYHDWLGKFFTKIYDARKNYTLNRYVDRVDPKNQSESYRKFLNFMWNLSLEDIKTIRDYYTKKS
ncbi:M48 family metallopeptidase [Riemerella columbina]|uniref:M48 family metallopeptidase n=1 Tax=Riemerella columbina TaxID=103810 RepID=UPI00266F0673|nr:M48 family metallopeptidase [Riemerella columbina]WKS95285.1 M48 family metallopeptidase [Riemerella columbina]